MTKVLVLSKCDERSKEILSTVGNKVEYTFLDKTASQEEKKSELNKAEIVIGVPEIEDIITSNTIKLLQLPMAGTDKYTSADNFPSNVILTNASGAFGDIISQYVLGGILNICQKFYLYRDMQKKCIWKDQGSEISLYGKHALIIGAGNIGSAVAKKLSVFNTYTVGIRRNIDDIPPFFNEMHTLEELDEQLPLADIIVLCIPRSDYTYHLIDKKRLMLMKKDAILVNVGRGALIVQDDLIDILNQGHLAGVVLDVVTPEPLPNDNPLWNIENVVITPHVSGKNFGHSREITDGIYRIAADNIKRYIEGMPLVNVIDFNKFKKA